MTALPLRAGHRTAGPRLVVDLGAIAANTRCSRTGPPAS